LALSFAVRLALSTEAAIASWGLRSATSRTAIGVLAVALIQIGRSTNPLRRCGFQRCDQIDAVATPIDPACAVPGRANDDVGAGRKTPG
jgi:hypothetical protein